MTACVVMPSLTMTQELVQSPLHFDPHEIFQAAKNHLLSTAALPTFVLFMITNIVLPAHRIGNDEQALSFMIKSQAARIATQARTSVCACRPCCQLSTGGKLNSEIRTNLGRILLSSNILRSCRYVVSICERGPARNQSSCCACSMSR